jgi:hypothetical protein
MNSLVAFQALFPLTGSRPHLGIRSSGDPCESGRGLEFHFMDAETKAQQGGGCPQSPRTGWWQVPKTVTFLKSGH